MSRPLSRILIGAPKSGSGKTLLTIGLMQLLKEEGRAVTSFKCGPDYIDPMFHRTVLGLPAGNLDSFLMTKEQIGEELARAAQTCDTAVIEGVMGLFDGLSVADLRASSYEIAQFTDTPILLVVDGKGAGRTLIATVKGILAEDVDHRIRGILLNRMSGAFYQMLREVFEKEIEATGHPARLIGSCPEMKNLELSSRHLGLVRPDEVEDLNEQIIKLAGRLKESIDLAALLRIMEEAPQVEDSGNWSNSDPEGVCAFGQESSAEGKILPGKRPLRLAVARDEAFEFYYPANLAAIRRLGIEIAEFSPLYDAALPEGISGLLLGGGYPELYAKELSQNSSMKAAILDAIEHGMPTLAECGGFLYLHRELETPEGCVYPLVGAIDAACRNQGRLVRFGYITLNGEGAIDGMRAHEFHYYDSEDNGEAALAMKPSGTRSWNCMHADPESGSWMGFPHLYYPSAPEFLDVFRAHMEEFERGKKR